MDLPEILILWSQTLNWSDMITFTDHKEMKVWNYQVVHIQKYFSL
jgi:hypothetical protein